MRAAAGIEECTVHPCEQQNDGMDRGKAQGRQSANHWPSSLKIWSVLVQPWGAGRRGRKGQQPAGGVGFVLPPFIVLAFCQKQRGEGRALYLLTLLYLQEEPMPRQQWWHNPATAQVSEEQLRDQQGILHVHTLGLLPSKPGSTCSLRDEIRWSFQSTKFCSKVSQLRMGR